MKEVKQEMRDLLFLHLELLVLEEEGAEDGLLLGVNGNTRCRLALRQRATGGQGQGVVTICMWAE